MASYTQFEPRKALRAIRELLDDPDDLPKVFVILEALSGDTLARVHARLASDASGARLLAERPDIVGRLEDREALRRLPEGSLGRVYLAFVESEGISPEGIREANLEGHAPERTVPAPLDYVQARMRDTHDLWHAVTGYKGDVLGELALLGFTLAQTWNPGIALIVAAGMLKTASRTWQLNDVTPGHARALIVEGFRRGRRAAWLAAAPWEELLARPVAEVRAVLGIDAPPQYIPIRTADLRANAVAA